MIPALIVILIDLLLLNVLYWGGKSMALMPEVEHGWFLWTISYVVSILAYQPRAQLRSTRIEKIATRATRAAMVMALVYGVYIWVDSSKGVRIYQILAITVCIVLVLLTSRLVCHTILRSFWRRHSSKKTVVFVGAGHNLAYLYHCMKSDLSRGFSVVGYFNEAVSQHLPEELPLLGNIDDVIPWLEQNPPQMLFCNLQSSRSEEIVRIINFCERNLIRFYSVPNVRNYVHRAMEVEMIDDMPVLTLRREPLRNPFRKMVKRGFDVFVSGLFLLTVFWWVYIIVAIITKITMPGPVLFRQKRNGLLGEEFYCLKFRSMKVNADADKLQATKDDPRKTKWGNIMRKTSIDELPQFLNVFVGDMSVVGPRPHMVRHTDEYSALIDKYMVRHWVKPGITGWAQVTGARGETEHLWQMEDRIKKDIWYIENWSLWLDIRIMFMTVWNAISGDKQAY